MGSKNRIAKFVLPIMIKEANEKGITTWVEPLVAVLNMRDKISNYNKMKNKEEKIDNHQGNVVLPCVSGSKLERIAQTKKLFDEGKIYFDHIKHEKSKNLIIGCDFGSGKDESRTHIFYYR